MALAVVQKKTVPKVATIKPRVVTPAVDTDLAVALERPVIQRKSACACGGYCPRCQAQNLNIQPKLNVGAPDDKYEREADRVADRFVNGKRVEQPLSTLPSQLQRKPLETGEQEQEEEAKAKAEPILQFKPQGAMPAEDFSVADADLKILQGKGEGLPDNLRSDFENLMGYDFNHVRVHIDGQAASLSQKLNARAFTLGNNVVFAPSQYQPTSTQGRHLLAHELTHVVQQTGSTARHAAINSRNISSSKQSIQRKVATAECRKTKLSDKQCDKVDSDYFLAIIYVKRAIDKLKAGKSSSVKRALKRYFNFNTGSNQHKQLLLKNLGLIKDFLIAYKDKAYYEKGHPNGCKTTKRGKPVAYSFPATIKDGVAEQLRRVGICKVYFSKGQGERVSTLIHEHAHISGLAPAKPADEVRVGYEGYFLLTPSRLLKCADSYAYFVMALATGSPVAVSTGVETGGIISATKSRREGSTRRFHRAAWYARAYLDVTSRTPVLKFFYPYGQLGITLMATPSIYPRPGVTGIKADNAFIADLLLGTRIKLRKSRTGVNWYINVGTGPMLVVSGIKDAEGNLPSVISGGWKTTVVGGLRYKKLVVKANMSFLYLPKVPGFKYSLQGGVAVGYRFTGL